MSSIFDSSLWMGTKCYITPENEFKNTYGKDIKELNIGEICIITFSAGFYKQVIAEEKNKKIDFVWPFGDITPLSVFETELGTRYSIHFPSYGSTRIANSLEQIAACGVKQVIGIGIGGTPQETISIEDIVLIEGSIQGSSASKYYAPIEYPAVADFDLTSRIAEKLKDNNIQFKTGISFSADAIYREEQSLIEKLNQLGVVVIDLESSTFLTVGRRLGLKCSWIGVISDKLVSKNHTGKVHSTHIMSTVMNIKNVVLKGI